MRSAVLVTGAVLLAIAAAGCGRPLPEDTPVATGPAETGAFEEPAAEEGAIAGVGAPGAPHAYLTALGDALTAEDPTATVTVAEGEPDFPALCARRVDAVAATGDAEEDVCDGADAAVGFHVADADGEPVVLWVNRESMRRFEVEALVQSAVDNGETLPQEAGLSPLPIETLQETQTKLERVIAGVG